MKENKQKKTGEGVFMWSQCGEVPINMKFGKNHLYVKAS